MHQEKTVEVAMHQEKTVENLPKKFISAHNHACIVFLKSVRTRDSDN